jgi:hypothetical protein
MHVTVPAVIPQGGKGRGLGHEQPASLPWCLQAAAGRAARSSTRWRKMQGGHLQNEQRAARHAEQRGRGELVAGARLPEFPC